MLLSADGKRLFVANANRNSVSVLETTDGRTMETLVATLPIPALEPARNDPAPPGNTPNSLALSPDGELLFVANANINTVAVFEVEEPGRARSLGFIPVGWYPTSVRVTPDGKRLLVANGKGVSSRSNRYLAQPGRRAMTGVQQYIGSLFDGTISFIDLPTGDAFEKRLAAWSERAFACVPDSARWVDPAQLEGNPIPRKAGDPSPIKYVIYIVKENRTYDQVLGDLGRGNGDPSLCLFDEKIAPNHHALAREFVCLDNFYVESEVSADGHEWSMGAYATDFVEKNWPLSYGHDRRNKFPYPSEGNFDRIARPAGGYLWDRAQEAGVSYRSYGEWVANGAKPDDPGRAKVKALEGHFDPMFRSFDMAYPDVKRAARFISELKRFEQEGEMPRLQIVRLPNDHTSGTSPGLPTPSAHVADNDLAFGQVVEASESFQILAADGHLRRRGRRAKRSGSRRCASHDCLRNQSLYPARHGRFEHVFHQLDAANDGTDPGLKTNEPVRRRGAADVCRRSKIPRTCVPTTRSRWTSTRKPPTHAPPGEQVSRSRWTFRRKTRPTILCSTKSSGARSAAPIRQCPRRAAPPSYSPAPTATMTMAMAMTTADRQQAPPQITA